MKKNILTFLLFIIAVNLNTKAQGIDFQDMPLEDALQKAKEEDKLVFVDFYTTWCMPCKVMDKKVYTLEEVGSIYNKSYVNIKLDAEKEGSNAAKKYRISSYPSFLFLNPEGKVVYKETGMHPANDFIQLGKKAAASVHSDYSLEKLQAEFPNKQDSPLFLKIYFEKMMEYGQNPTYGIDAWLKAQNEIEEDDVDMMEFLLKYKEYILLGSKGEEILKDNFDEYMDIATRSEEKDLEIFKVQIVKNTRDFALEKKDPDLYKTFIEGFNKLPEKYKKRGNLLDYKITYYALLKDVDSYKDIIETYVDSLMTDKSIDQIKKEDKSLFEEKKEMLGSSYSPQVVQLYNDYKNGWISGNIVKNLYQKGKAYLKNVETKEEYKNLKSWVDYGYELGTNSYYMDDLLADWYYKKGKNKKALTMKKKAIENWPEKDIKLPAIKYELEQMQKDSSI